MAIAARQIFYKLKSCLISVNPLQMASHGSWDKEANSQHHLLALHDSDPPGPSSLPCNHHGGGHWTCNFLPYTLVLPSHCSSSGMFFPPSLFTCWVLLKFQGFSWDFAFWGNFSRSREVKSSVTKVPLLPGLSRQSRFSPVVWLLAPSHLQI